MSMTPPLTRTVHQRILLETMRNLLLMGILLAGAGTCRADEVIELDPERKWRFFGSFDYQLPGKAGRGTQFDLASKELGYTSPYGYGSLYGYRPDQVHKSLKVTPGYGGRVGASYTLDRFGMDVGGSFGYLVGPEIVGVIVADDPTIGRDS